VILKKKKKKKKIGVAQITRESDFMPCFRDLNRLHGLSQNHDQALVQGDPTQRVHLR